MARNAPYVNYYAKVHLKVGNRLKVTTTADLLRQDILLGRLKHGEPLLQKPLAEKYRVSTVIVREAFKQLIPEGFLEVGWGGGPSVVSLTYTEAWDLALERSKVEPWIFNISAQRMSQANVDNMKRAILSFNTSKPVGRNTDVDDALLRYLYVNIPPRTTQPVYQHRAAYRKYRSFLWRFANELEKHKADYLTIAAYCADGDAKRASDAMWNHIIDTGRSLTARLRDLSDIQYPFAGLGPELGRLDLA
jgi:DNA-binding GntR family transcriptional regulator